MLARANFQFEMNGMLKDRLRKLTPRARRWLTLAVIVVVAGFFLRTFQQSWDQMQGAFHRPHFGWLAVSAAGFSIFYYVRILGWRAVLKALGHPLPRRSAARTLMLSEITRYVPGNVWSVFSRVGLSVNTGMTADRAFVATVAEILALLAASLIVGGGFATLASDIPTWARYLAIAGGIGAVVLALVFSRLDRALQWLLHKFGKTGITWSFSARAFIRTVATFCIAWVGFTLGSYAVAAAFLKLQPNTALLLLATFPIAWFLGYASFVTPSGIGVREAAIAVLLSPVYGSVGVIIATYSRVAMTIVELGWVAGSAWQDVWRGLQAAWRWLRSPRGVVITVSFLFAVYFSAITVAMHAKVITSRFDLGNMDQVVWNTSHGRIFEFTNPYTTENVVRYIHHADIFLVLFAPFYWLYASPNVLLVAQAVVVALGGWLVYRLAKRVLGHDWLAAVLALAFLFYPTLQRAVLFDFHSLTLAATFGVGMVLAYVERRWKTFAMFAVLFALCKEELPLMIASLAVLMLWRHWREVPIRKIAFTTLAVSVAYFGITYFAIMPAARDGASSKYVVQYDVLGTSPKEMLQNISANPRLLLAMVGGAQARHMYAGQLGPVGFLPLASPFWLALAWPDYVVNLFNERIEPRLMIYHYQAAIAGFVFIASIFGVAAIRRRVGPWWDRWLRRTLRISLEGVLIVYILVVTGVESYRLSPLPYSQTKDMRVFWPAPMAPVIHDAIANVPESAKVSATNTVGAQLAHREHLYQFPNGVGEADYIFVLLAKAGTLEWQRNHVQAESLATDPRYEKFIEVKNFTAYRKR